MMNTSSKAETIRKNQFKAMIAASKKIEVICRPLKNLLQIPFFANVTFDQKLEFLFLSSNQSLFQHLIDRHSIFHFNQYLLNFCAKPGYHYINMHKQFNDDPRLRLIRESFYETKLEDFLVLTHYDKSNQKLNYYLFGGMLENSKSVNAYINFQSQLKHFCSHFELEIENEKKMIAWSNAMPNHTSLNNYIALNDTMDLKTIFASSLESRSANISELAPVQLSKREITMVEWFLRGKNARETAAILSISNRTVESHFDRMRKKLRCFTKYQVAQKVIEMGLLDHTSLKADLVI